MNALLCHREDEVLEALARGYVGAELEEHIASCASCGELRLLAGALIEERAEAVNDATVPAAGTMWWRMRVRRRQEVQTAARRSLFIGQAATLGIALALIVAFLGPEIVVGVRHFIAAIRTSTPLLLAVATWLLIAPIMGWVAIRQK